MESPLTCLSPNEGRDTISILGPRTLIGNLSNKLEYIHVYGVLERLYRFYSAYLQTAWV